MMGDLLRVLRLWRGRGPALAAALLVSVCSALLGLALLGMAGRAVAAEVALAGGVALGSGILLLPWLRPVLIGRPAARWAERMATHGAAFRALADTRVWFFRRLSQRLPGGIGHGRAGDLLGRLVADVEALDGLYLRAIVPIAAGGAVVLATAVVLGAMSPLLAALVALPLAAALVLPPLLAPAAARAAATAADAEGRLRDAVVDPLSGLEDTLGTGAEARALARVAAAGDALAASQRALTGRNAAAGALGSLLAQGALLGALGFGLAGGQGALAGAVIGAFLALASAEPFAALPRAGVALAAAGASARRLFAAADVPVPVPDPATPAAAPAGHALKIEGLRFAWAPDRAPVFEGLDMEVPEGARVALLGPSGVGKSSLIALLTKLAAPQGGRILVGGVDLATLTADAARQKFAVLSQDARLFDDTIAANLRLAAPDADDAALFQALDRAGIGDLVRALPEGLATRCGEAGARFSGGQVRRIALARALVSPAPVLLLDEPAAGLDAAAEMAFLATLDTAAAGRTVLLLQHRLVGPFRPSRVFRLAGGRALAGLG
ncbi:thiol reductant ABC exporter subunit CydC [Humitalea sp. 24SJ18S-53]|uniref:thiol reductant ABC exporter subunit CydC n=1 Tax=Humitalea sp. 24SJ18S-53 TaxID=3422307 RepID=UPI003D66F107